MRHPGAVVIPDARHHPFIISPDANRSSMASILVINGPNLNLLGTREPEVYGRDTLTDINARLTEQAKAAGHHLLTLQSNAESELIERIHAARAEGIDFIIFNPA